ncbi:hypothetical protein [Lysinibacillus capsici]|uniref:hypothetical protein n=1 Tax=Lysinibacillus capsici TaxID=2115968 RepID=UPI0034E606A3
MVIANVLFDNNGNFIWVSITAIAAVIAIFINTYIAYRTTKANFKANVVAKSRIEWIQEVRKKSADFIAACYDLFEILEVYEEQKDKDPETIKEIARLKNEVQKNGTLLTLYFGPDSSENNKLIVLIIDELITILTEKNIRHFRKVLPIDKNHLNILQDFLRIYFKAEWKRANGELKDSKIQEYLDKNDSYKKILEIFKEKLEGFEDRRKDYYQHTKNYYDHKKSQQIEIKVQDDKTP